MAAFDQQPLRLTKRFKAALKELCVAEMEMMQNHEPGLADCWTWCEVEVGDLASCKGLSFQFGGEDDKPKGMRGQVRIVEPDPDNHLR